MRSTSEGRQVPIPPGRLSHSLTPNGQWVAGRQKCIACDENALTETIGSGLAAKMRCRRKSPDRGGEGGGQRNESVRTGSQIHWEDRRRNAAGRRISAACWVQFSESVAT